MKNEFDAIDNAILEKDTKDELRTYKIAYKFEPDTTYYLFISQGKFLILHPTASFPFSDVPLYFKRISSNSGTE